MILSNEDVFPRQLRNRLNVVDTFDDHLTGVLHLSGVRVRVTGKCFRLKDAGYDEKRYDGKCDKRHLPIVDERDGDTGKKSGNHLNDRTNARPKALKKKFTSFQFFTVALFDAYGFDFGGVASESGRENARRVMPIVEVGDLLTQRRAEHETS